MEFNAGDKVRVKDRKDWVSPPGYRLANSEGTVVKIGEYEDFSGDLKDNIMVRIEKTEADVKTGSTLVFRADNLEKL